MADRFEVDAIGIEDERAIIVRMIMRPKTRAAIVFPSGFQRRFVERIHLGPGRRDKGDVNAGAMRTAVADPEERFSILSITDAVVAAGEFRRHFHDDGDAQGQKRRIVKAFGGFKIADTDTDMIEHCRFSS